MGQLFYGKNERIKIYGCTGEFVASTDRGGRDECRHAQSGLSVPAYTRSGLYDFFREFTRRSRQFLNWTKISQTCYAPPRKWRDLCHKKRCSYCNIGKNTRNCQPLPAVLKSPFELHWKMLNRGDLPTISSKRNKRKYIPAKRTTVHRVEFPRHLFLQSDGERTATMVPQMTLRRGGSESFIIFLL